MLEVLQKFATVELVLIIGLMVSVVAIVMLITETIRRGRECAQLRWELTEMNAEMVALRAEVFALETLTNTLKRVVRRLENAKTYPG